MDHKNHGAKLDDNITGDDLVDPGSGGRSDVIFSMTKDRNEYERIEANIESLPVPSVREIAKDFIQRHLGVNGDEYIIAHFKTSEARTQGKPDETMSLTDAVMQVFPGFSDQGVAPAIELGIGGVLGGGQSSPSAATFANGVFHSDGVGDFFKRLGGFLWSRTGPGYVYNTFFAEGNVLQTGNEHVRSVDEAFGVYHANGKGFSGDNRSDLKPSEMVDAFAVKDFGPLPNSDELPYIKEVNSDLDSYWNKVKNDWPIVARYNFVQEAREAYKQGKLTVSEYESVMKGGAPGIPLYGPTAMDQLRRSVVPDSSVRVERLDIYGYPATDIIRFIRADKSEVVYIPGRQPAFESVGPGRSHDWLMRDAKDPSRLNALLSHFSVYQKQDGTSYSGVATALKGLANGESWPFNSKSEAISSDVFDDMRAQVEQRMSSDASMQTRTAWEGWRHTINRVSVMFGPLGAPVQLGTGLDQAINGKTAEERKEGVIQAEDSAAAIMLAKVGGEGADSADNVDIRKKSPNFKSPTRLPDGRYGYPAGPIEPPKLGDEVPAPKIENPSATQSTAGRLKIIAQAAAGADLNRPLTPAEQQVVDGGFVTKKHLIAITEASKKGHFAVGFRDTGKEALMWLDKGAATKPHTILEKTLKAERVPENLRQGVADSGLQGLAAHWEDGRPVGVFVTRAAAKEWRKHSDPQVRRDNQGNFYVPVNFAEPQDRNLVSLKSQPDWEKTVITGDYDTHDMVMITGAGGPHTVVSESSEESFIRGAINTAVSAVDPDRAGQEHRVVQHGPQVNYPAFAMSKEGLRDKLVPAVAHPSLPVAMVDHRGIWKIIQTLDELTSFYKSIGAELKDTWKAGKQHTHFADVGDRQVGIRPANYKSS
ncbi:dermonecrotic toxin domain-containing protein [Burkholderia pyrrocinia]